MKEQLHKERKYKDASDKVWLVGPVYTRKFTDKQDITRLFLYMVCSMFKIATGPRELDFLSFILLRDDGVVSGTGRTAYCEKYQLSRPQVDITVSRLRKKKLLVKTRSETRIDPRIVMNFKNNKNFIFQFKCTTE